MAKSVFVTRRIPEKGLSMLREKGFEVDISPENRPLTKSELIDALKKKPYDAVLSLLTDTIDGEVMDAVPSAKIFANYAVGYNNMNIEDANARGVTLTNTPGGLTDTVAEHTIALLLALSCRIVEGDRCIREGRYNGWDPMLLLGTDLRGKTLGILGTGHIGSRVVQIASLGLGMKVAYYDVKRNEELEKAYGATYYATPEELLPVADVVSLHVPLLDSTRHMINADRLKLMKKTAYLVNTARGPVIDEVSLVEALKSGTIRGAGLDVFENEPSLAPGLAELPSVVLTPHIASATESTRDEMSEMAARNIIEFLEGRIAPNKCN